MYPEPGQVLAGFGRNSQFGADRSMVYWMQVPKRLSTRTFRPEFVEPILNLAVQTMLRAVPFVQAHSWRCVADRGLVLAALPMTGW